MVTFKDIFNIKRLKDEVRQSALGENVEYIQFSYSTPTETDDAYDETVTTTEAPIYCRARIIWMRHEDFRPVQAGILKVGDCQLIVDRDTAENIKEQAEVRIYNKEERTYKRFRVVRKTIDAWGTETLVWCSKLE